MSTMSHDNNRESGGPQILNLCFINWVENQVTTRFQTQASYMHQTLDAKNNFESSNMML
jgi:hypothetical protein